MRGICGIISHRFRRRARLWRTSSRILGLVINILAVRFAKIKIKMVTLRAGFTKVRQEFKEKCRIIN